MSQPLQKTFRALFFLGLFMRLSISGCRGGSERCSVSIETIELILVDFHYDTDVSATFQEIEVGEKAKNVIFTVYKIIIFLLP